MPLGVVDVTERKTSFIPIVDPVALATRAFIFAGVVAGMGMILGGRPPTRGRWRSAVQETKASDALRAAE